MPTVPLLALQLRLVLLRLLLEELLRLAERPELRASQRARSRLPGWPELWALLRAERLQLGESRQPDVQPMVVPQLAEPPRQTNGQ